MARRITIYRAILSLLLLPTILTAQEWRPFGPTGGDVGQVVEDAADGTLYIVGRLHGIHRLRPGAQEWEPVAAPPGSDPTNQILSVTVWKGRLFVRSGCCFLSQSSDGGETWNRIVLATDDFMQNGYFAARGDSIFIKVTSGSTTHLFGSGDGVGWSPVEEIDSWWGLVVDDGTLYALSSYGLLRREETGRWDTLRKDEVQNVMADGGTLVVINRMDSLFRSFDRGATWEWYPDTVSAFATPLHPILHNDTLWKTHKGGLLVMPVDGDGWIEWGPRGDYSAYPWVSFTRNRMLLHGGLRAFGLHRWDAATGRFVRFDRGQYGQRVDQIVTVGDTVVALVYDRIFVTGDEGATWHDWMAPFPALQNRIVAGDDEIYSLGYDTLFRSTDLGRTWIGSPIIDETGSDLSVSRLFIHDGDLFAGGRVGVRFDIFRSRDGGLLWEQLSILNQGEVEQVVVAPDDTIFVRLFSGDPLMRSVDDGTTWERVALSHETADVTYLAHTGGVLLVGTYQDGLFRSFDGGVTWTQTLRFDLQESWVDTNYVLIDRIDVYGDTVFAHIWRRGEPTSTIYASPDRGATWRRIVQPPSGSRLIHLSGGRLLSATERASIQVTTFTLGVEEECRPSAPIDIAHDPTHDLIRWSTPTPTAYAIDLYTIGGAHVMTVERGEAEAGERTVAMPEMVSGLYLCTIRTPHGDAGILVRVE